MFAPSLTPPTLSNELSKKKIIVTMISENLQESIRADKNKSNHDCFYIFEPLSCPTKKRAQQI